MLDKKQRRCWLCELTVICDFQVEEEVVVEAVEKTGGAVCRRFVTPP